MSAAAEPAGRVRAGLTAQEEERLTQRLLRLQTTSDDAVAAAAARQQWYSSALAFLQAHGGQHWWCRHGEITAGLVEVLRYHHEQPLVQAIWCQLSAQLAVCTDCVNAHHQAQALFLEQFSPDSAQPLLAALHELDCARVAATLGAVQALQEGQELPAEVIAALFEALTYDALLADAEAADSLAAALCTLSVRYDLALAEPGGARYPGAYRLLAHPSADARRLVAVMVRLWGPFREASSLDLVLPTLQQWVAALDGTPSSADSPSSSSNRRPFRPPTLAVWRALHGLLPLVQGEAGAALLPLVPRLADAVLAGMSGESGPLRQLSVQEADTCAWFATGCWSHLLASAGPEVFYHTSASPAAVVQQLAAAAGASGSERLHKAAAEAVAATLLHAAGSSDGLEMRSGLLFLLHDVPEGAAAASQQQPQQQQQPARPRFSQLTAAVAEAAAFSTLLQLLQQGGTATESVFRCAHFWLPPLCASLRQHIDGGSPEAGMAQQHQQQQQLQQQQQQLQQQQRRSPALFAAADKAALRLAAALLGAEVAALTGSASSAASIADEAGTVVVTAAAEQAGAWHSLPALWHALTRSSGSQDCSTLLLAATAALAAIPSGPGSGTAVAVPAPRAAVGAGAGFAAPGLTSSLATDVASAQRLVPATALRRWLLAEDPAAPSPSAISISRGPPFLSELLQQAGAELLGQLTRLCRGAVVAAPAERHWASEPQRWQLQLALAVARLLLAHNALSQAAAEEYALAATRQGSLAAAAATLAQIHPAAAPVLQPLLARQARAEQLQQQRPKSCGSGNPFVRQVQAAQQRQMLPPPSRSGRQSAAATEVVDLTDSPQREPAPLPVAPTSKHASQGSAAVAKQLQQQSQAAEAPWYLQWPSTAQQPQQQQHGQRQAAPPPAQQPQRQGQRQQPVQQALVQRQQQQTQQQQRQAAPAAAQHPQRIQQQQQQQQQAGSRNLVPPSGRWQQEQVHTRQPAKQQQQQQQQGQQGQQIDVESLWPDKFPARKPSTLPAAGSSGSGAAGPSSRAGSRAGSRGSSRSGSPEPLAGGRPRQAEQPVRRRPGSRSASPDAASRRQRAAPLGAVGQKAGSGTTAPFRIPKRPSAAAAAAAAPAATAPSSTAVAARKQPAAGTAAPAVCQPAAPSRAANTTGAVAQPVAVQQQQRQPSLDGAVQLLEEDDSLFAGLDAAPPQQAQQQQQRRTALPPPRAQQAQQPALVRRIVRLAAPPPAAGKRGAQPTAVPLWQQRRAALGAARQAAAAAAALLTLDALLQQLLSWDPHRLLSPGGSAALQGLKVPVRFDSLQQYTEVFSQLLLEELRAHLLQAAEESPAAASLCGGGGRRGGGGEGSWCDVAAALTASGATHLRLLEVQRQSDLHLLRFEPAASMSTAGGQQQPGRQVDSAAEFRRSSGIRTEDLLLLVSRPTAAPGAAVPAGVAAGGAPLQAAVALASVESLHQQQLSERRQTQGIEGRSRQLLITARVSLRGGSSAGGNGGRQLLQQQLTAGTSWQAVRLMSLTPHLRQLQALVAAQRLPPLLLAELLSPGTTRTAVQRQPKHLATVQPALPPALLHELVGQFNSSQQKAIAAAAAGYLPTAAAAASAGAAAAAAYDGPGSSAARPQAVQQAAREQLVLVQGPPGTGKSAAILGMCSALLAANTPRSTIINGSSKGGDGGSKAAAAAALKLQRAVFVNPAVRVLLCAQSNAAVDELCTRLANRGVVGRDGAQRQVALVRFGPLEAISPDAAVQHIDAAAAQMEAGDAGLGGASGQSSQLASRLQALRLQLRALQSQIDALDGSMEESRKRRRQQGQGGGPAAARDRKRLRSGSVDRGGGNAEGSGVGGASSMDMSGSSSEEEEEEGSDPAAAGTCGADFPSSQEVRQQLGPLLQRKQQLKKEAAAAAGALRASSAAAAARRKELRAAVVAQSEVVAATLSSAGGELLQLMPRAGGANGSASLLGFDAVIVDEAAQALEPSVLIALQLLAPGGRLVLVGDPQQLPATVVSRAAAAASLAQSLFERLAQAGYPVVMLKQQYRMHPAISAWPSAFFYGNKLQDAAAVKPEGGGGRAAPWHERRRLPPLAFWDCREGQERGGGGGASVSNAGEAEVAWALYAGLVARYRGDVGDVAIITPYKAQLGLLRRTFHHRGGATAAEAVTFATVDGFQGREADVVIFSCVRAHASGAAGGVGFLADVRRMNVALTRARRSLWIIGHSATLAGCQPWQELMEHCRQQRRLFTAIPPYERLLD